MRAHINPAKCTGHAQCAATAAQVYELDDHGYSTPLDEEIPVHLQEAARTGAAACPEHAIEIVE